MKNKAPIFTYIISFLNPIIPSFIILFLGMCFVMYTTIDTDTREVISEIKFIELYYPVVIFSIYLCMGISVLHYYVIRKGILRPRWWVNLLLIIFGYSIIPLSAVISGIPPPVRNANANTIVFLNYYLVVFLSIIGFVIVTLVTKKKSNQILDPTWTTPVLKVESDSQAGQD
jgi:hypothetical protein